MSDSIATSVAYKALLSVGMPEVGGPAHRVLANLWVVGYATGQKERDLLTMHALRWLSSLKDVEVGATFNSADEAYLEVFVDGEYLFFDDYNQDLLWAICNAAKAWKAEQPAIETTKGE